MGIRMHSHTDLAMCDPHSHKDEVEEEAEEDGERKTQKKKRIRIWGWPAQVLRRRAERNIASGFAPGAAPGGAPPPRNTPPSPRRLLHISKSESEAPGDGHALSIIIPGNGHSYSQTFTTQISVMLLGPFSLAGVGNSYMLGIFGGRAFNCLYSNFR